MDHLQMMLHGSMQMNMLRQTGIHRIHHGLCPIHPIHDHQSFPSRDSPMDHRVDSAFSFLCAQRQLLRQYLKQEQHCQLLSTSPHISENFLTNMKSMVQKHSEHWSINFITFDTFYACPKLSFTCPKEGWMAG